MYVYILELKEHSYYITTVYKPTYNVLYDQLAEEFLHKIWKTMRFNASTLASGNMGLGASHMSVALHYSISISKEDSDFRFQNVHFREQMSPLKQTTGPSSF